jgi:DNA-binding NtrC family response regulator
MRAGDMDPAGAFVGASEAAREVRRRIRAFASVTVPVLVTGATGTGKDVVARALHAASARAAAPFVPVNCAALPEALLEGELFGAARGAYTGADRDRDGLIAAAAGGTLFLDEVGELPPAGQAKLLRFLDAGAVRPLGAARERRVETRVVAASHRDLAADARSGGFREDLLFRLDVLRIHVPPLCERPEDVGPLARHFAARLATDAGPIHLSAQAVADLARRRWPGNARELAAALARALVEQGPTIRRLREAQDGAWPPAGAADPRSRLDALLARYRGDLHAVARQLGVSVRTVQRRLARNGLRAAAYRPESGPISARRG